jgi:hypothetical protein
MRTKPEIPKPPMGHILCDGCMQSPGRCTCKSFLAIVFAGLLMAAMGFGFVMGLRVGIAHTEEKLKAPDVLKIGVECECGSTSH